MSVDHPHSHCGDSIAHLNPVKMRFELIALAALVAAASGALRAPEFVFEGEVAGTEISFALYPVRRRSRSGGCLSRLPTQSVPTASLSWRCCRETSWMWSQRDSAMAWE